MARRRKYVEDLTYGEWHRKRLPELYSRTGHRQDQADRDWTEYCHYCKEPITIIEEVIDHGQDLGDKATTVTKKMAGKAGIPAFLMAMKIERPPEIQAEIDELSQRLLDLYEQSAGMVSSFKVRRIWPDGRGAEFHQYEPDEWAEHLLVMHRDHHLNCFVYRNARQIPVKEAALAAAKVRSKSYSPVIDQGSLPIMLDT